MTELSRAGRNFRGIINDLKRRPEDAAHDLGVSVKHIQAFLAGEKELSPELVKRATQVWPVNERDFFLMHDDNPTGVVIMKAEQSAQKSRIMDRAGSPYYDYRDTAMSSVAPFRPEWISELCHVENNDPDNPKAQWNNGHFMHQFTYFIGDVNFYYRDSQGNKQVAVMNTGDSMYITPFVPHTFTTREGADKDGLILALTYGNKVVGDAQQELSALGLDLATEFAMDFSTRKQAAAALLNFHREAASVGIDELAARTKIDAQKINETEQGAYLPSFAEYERLANALKINVRDLLPNDHIEQKVILHPCSDARRWAFPEDTQAYSLVELAQTKDLPFSKALEITVNGVGNDDLDLRAGLHQYGYNVGDTPVQMNWSVGDSTHNDTINPGDSFVVKPFIPHNYRGEGKLLILRIGGKVNGDAQRELSNIGREKVHRAFAEDQQWYDPKGKS